MPRPEWSFFMLPEDHKEVKWSMSFLRAKFTSWGQIIFGLILVGTAISSVGTQIAAYYFVSLVSALFFTSLFLSSFFKPKLSAVRSLPPTPTAGGISFYRVTVTNTGDWPLRNLEVFDHRLPYGLYYVLNHPEQRTYIDWLDPDQKTVFTIAMRTPRRGSFIIEPLMAGTGFPTGLIRSTARVTGRDQFIVFPKLLKVKDLALDLQHRFQPGGTTSSSKFGSSNEFLSTREYREGDRPRDIHWNSSARAGKLIVKEYIDEYFVRVGIFLDTELQRFEKHLCFEARISLCGGIAEDLYNKNYLVDLFLSDSHSPHVEIGGGRDQFSHLLEMLSAVEGEPQVNFARPLAMMKEQADGMSGLVLLLKDWDEARAAFVKTIKELNVPTRIFIIRDKPLTLPVSDLAVTVYSAKELGYKL
ncbi:MAG: DUF58 domain-containing protein [Candidatus Omnitrophica bacterium]|nr:DUF58 domain-containing protein [Candidatus Omnitrophota bacterium]